VADADGPPGDVPEQIDPADPTDATAVDAVSRPFGARTSEPGTVHVFVGADRTRIVLAGEIDTELGPDLLEAAAAAEQARQPIEVDAHHVTFMDSSGVAFLARLATRSASPVRLIRVPPTVGFLLEVTRIGELLDVVEDDPGSEL
jgi:anti-sigma B factor antagonist